MPTRLQEGVRCLLGGSAMKMSKDTDFIVANIFLVAALVADSPIASLGFIALFSWHLFKSWQKDRDQ